MTREEAIAKLVAYAFWASEHVPDDVAQALDMAIEALTEETICPILSDDEVKQPCIKSPCGFESGFERVNGDCRDRLKEVFREYSSISGDMFHLSQIENIIDGEDWL